MNQVLDGKTVLKAVAIFLVMCVLYFLSRSPGLDEFDCVNFALGLRQFNLWEHQPHPPGYPLYIFFGWVVQKLFGAEPQGALELVSAVGGGMFVAAWFLTIRLQFTERLAWWITVSLIFTPIVWMSSTKVLSDSLASGLLSLEIFVAVYFSERKNLGSFLIAALLGALATGVRPQLILIALLVLASAATRAAASPKVTLTGLATYSVACLTWLIPTCILQARLRPGISAWVVYPELLFGQWKWRLNNPYAYIGAGSWTPKYLSTRFADHILGWFGLGFGMIESWPVMILGAIIFLTGWGLYLYYRRELHDSGFWRFHLPWALLHIAIIFAFLGGKQRYYLVILPLVLVATFRGWLNIPTPSKWIAAVLPVLFCYVAIPAAVESHRIDSPPVQLIRYLQRIYPPEKRSTITLLFTNAQRQAEWYAPEFRIFPDIPPGPALDKAIENATAVYTDSNRVPLPEGWHSVPVTIFQRSPIIHSKHHALMLYLVLRDA